MVETMNAALLGCQPSGIRRFTALAKAEPGCLFLTIGEPDFSTPEPIKEATKTALDQNLTHYPPGAGELYLRERISRFEQEQNGVSYSPEEILVVDGATEGLYLALRGILNPGDEVIVPTPAFGLYEPLVALSSGVYVPMDTCADHFQITPQNLAQHITAKSKAILLNSPNNPTGAVYTPESLDAVYQVAKEKNLFVLCDDVYAQLVYGPYQRFFPVSGHPGKNHPHPEFFQAIRHDWLAHGIFMRRPPGDRAVGKTAFLYRGFCGLFFAKRLCGRAGL